MGLSDLPSTAGCSPGFGCGGFLCGEDFQDDWISISILDGSIELSATEDNSNDSSSVLSLPPTPEYLETPCDAFETTLLLGPGNTVFIRQQQGKAIVGETVTLAPHDLQDTQAIRRSSKEAARRSSSNRSASSSSPRKIAIPRSESAITRQVRLRRRGRRGGRHRLF